MRARLLRWYDVHKRDLPWRRTRDPYAIWIAETMLQQTQVATVLPYYDRFMQSFPSLAALDRATLRSVLSVWTGLGYYRRAENLKKAARILVRDHDGRLPCDYPRLLQLPGVGKYTAGALMSIAFDKPCAASDGNARRVYSRLLGLGSVKESDTAAVLMVSHRRPGDYTQAVMELGSTICTPSTPRCPDCPLAHWCLARRSGNFNAVRQPRPRTTDVDWPVVFVEAGGAVLLHRRPRSGLLAGLWELPAMKTLINRFGELRTLLEDQAPVSVIRHTITNHRIAAPLYILHRHVRVHGPAWAWIPLPDIPAYPLSSLCTKAIRIARDRLDSETREKETTVTGHAMTGYTAGR